MRGVYDNRIVMKMMTVMIMMMMTTMIYNHANVRY